ncbi:MAG TPA: hypothetical protein VIJ39_01635 [Solirubrobacteraceae bacterium]
MLGTDIVEHRQPGCGEATGHDIEQAIARSTYPTRHRLLAAEQRRRATNREGIRAVNERDRGYACVLGSDCRGDEKPIEHDHVGAPVPE